MHSTRKMTTYHLLNLLEMMTSADKDYRFMATNDLMTELRDHNINLDHDSEKKLVRMLLKLLEDNNGEVQNVAVKCMGRLVGNVKDDLVENIVECLCANMLSKNEQLRDISAVGLKTVLAHILPAAAVPSTAAPTRPSALPASIVGRITPRIVSTVSSEDVSVQLEALDILADLLSRFGLLVVPYHASILDALELQLSSTRLAVRKKSIVCLGHLSAKCHGALYARLVDVLLECLSENGSPSSSRTFVLCLRAVGRSSGPRFGPCLDRVLPLVFDLCRVRAAGGNARSESEDDELRENCLQACETFVRACPKNMRPHLDALVDLCLEYVAYDPNYKYDDEDEDPAVECGVDGKDAMDGNGDGVDAVDEECSDDDDVSWKVRRAAAKCLEAVVVADCAFLPAFFEKVGPRLVARFIEREENVKADILRAYTSTLKQVPRPAAEDQVETEVGPEHPRNLLLAQVPALVRGVRRQMREPGAKTRLGCLTLLTELVAAAPGCLDAYIPALIPGILSSLRDSSVRMETLSFLHRLLCASSPRALHPHVSVLLTPVIQAVGDRSHKMSSEALLVTQQMVKVMRPAGVRTSDFDCTPYVNDVYEAALLRLRAAEVDQEVRERAVSCLGVVLSHMGDKLTAQVTTCLPILVDGLRSETTPLAAVKALSQIASSPLGIDLRPILGEAVPLLTSFLRKAQRPLRLSTLLLLDVLVKNKYAQALGVQSLQKVVLELPRLISADDLQATQWTLVLLASIAAGCKEALVDVERIGTLNEVGNLLRSPLLRGVALDSVLSFFRTLAAAQLPGLGFSELLNFLLALSQGPGIATLNRQANRSVAKCVSALVAERPSEAVAVVDRLLADVKSPLSDGVHVFSLFALGEIGRDLDLSGVPGLRETLLDNLGVNSEEVQSAASCAIGLSSLSNLSVGVPFLLSEIRGGAKRRYLLLHALKEVIVHQSSSPEGAAALGPFVADVWALLFVLAAEACEEGTRNVVAECLGRLTRSDPAALLPRLRDRLGHESAFVRGVLVAAAKFAVSNEPHGIDPLLEQYFGDFMAALDDEDLAVRHVALVTFNSAACNKPALVRDLLPGLLPRLYRETDVRQDLIREVEMGPFTHTVDEGLDLRKAAFECMYTLLDSPVLLPRLDLDAFLDRVRSGLRDHHDIKMLTYLTLSRLACLAPDAVLSRLDELVEPLKCTCVAKAAAKSVTQECEKLEDLKRAALRVVVVLRGIPDADENLGFSKFVATIVASKDLKALYDSVQKDAAAGGGGSYSSLGEKEGAEVDSAVQRDENPGDVVDL